MTMIKVALVSTLLLLPMIIEDSYAHGIVSVKDCTKDNLPYNQELYREDIMSINQAATFYVEGNPHYKMNDFASYMVNVYLNQPVELAHCLRELGVNPASVAQLTPLADHALTFDKANLEGYSRDFLAEVPHPEDNHVQNALQVQRQNPIMPNGPVQAQKPLPLGIDSAQAADSRVKSFEPAPDQLQISLEQLLVAILVVVIVIGLALLLPMAKKRSWVLVIPKRSF